MSCPRAAVVLKEDSTRRRGRPPPRARGRARAAAAEIVTPVTLRRVLAGCEHREAPPAAADLEHVVARPESELLADARGSFRSLRLARALGGLLPDGAGVRQGLVEDEREEFVAEVVVVRRCCGGRAAGRCACSAEARVAVSRREARCRRAGARALRKEQLDRARRGRRSPSRRRRTTRRSRAAARREPAEERRSRHAAATIGARLRARARAPPGSARPAPPSVLEPGSRTRIAARSARRGPRSRLAGGARARRRLSRTDPRRARTAACGRTARA